MGKSGGGIEVLGDAGTAEERLIEVADTEERGVALTASEAKLVLGKESLFGSHLFVDMESRSKGICIATMSFP